VASERTGLPSHRIVETAREERADLVIMGPHGRGVSRLLLGSVAERVIRSAPCPVLTVRKADSE
jgi:nucleotide-binding universal stress UspA family protein